MNDTAPLPAPWTPVSDEYLELMLRAATTTGQVDPVDYAMVCELMHHRRRVPELERRAAVLARVTEPKPN